MTDFPQTLLKRTYPTRVARRSPARRKAVTWLAFGMLLKLAVGAAAFVFFADPAPADARHGAPIHPLKEI